MTTTSLNFRQAAYAQETGRVPIALITITHNDLTEPIRISCDPTQRIEALTTATQVVYGTLSNGETYIYLPVTIKLPDDTDNGSGEMTMEIDNIHRSMTEAIRTICTPAICQVDIVLDNALNTIERSWPEFQLTRIQYDAMKISGTLKAETLENEPFPSGTFTPGQFPGLFK